MELKCLMKLLINAKPMVIKARGLRYINKDETTSSGETVFVKGKNDTLNQLESPKKTSLYTHYKKTRHSQLRCYTRFLESFELK